VLYPTILHPAREVIIIQEIVAPVSQEIRPPPAQKGGDIPRIFSPRGESPMNIAPQTGESPRNIAPHPL
jgi:hypothetical protein